MNEKCFIQCIYNIVFHKYLFFITYHRNLPAFWLPMDSVHFLCWNSQCISVSLWNKITFSPLFTLWPMHISWYACHFVEYVLLYIQAYCMHLSESVPTYLGLLRMITTMQPCKNRLLFLVTCVSQSQDKFLLPTHP